MPRVRKPVSQGRSKAWSTCSEIGRMDFSKVAAARRLTT
jgi:hypothetical protein